MIPLVDRKQILRDVGIINGLNEDETNRLPVSSVRGVSLKILSQLDNNPISQFSQLGALVVLVLSHLTGDSGLLSRSTGLANKTLGMNIQ